MKLQIISRLSKNQRLKYDTTKSVMPSSACLVTQTCEVHQRINQYYSINTEWISEPYEKQNKLDYREFFNNFNNNCEVKYEPIDFKPPEIKRKLAPLLEAKRATINIPNAIESKQQSISQKLQQLQTESKHSYFYQKGKQKIRKVNSLIALDSQENAHRMEETRKPGFIKQNKSLKKKESSLQITKVNESNKENIDFNDKSKGYSKCTSKMSLDIDDSKERIANIRRELNEIYQMRNRQAHNKLKII